MKKKFIVGIDVSKKTLDVYFQTTHEHFVVSNDPSGFAVLLGKIRESQGSIIKSELMVCFENTGKYSKLLSVFLESEEIPFFMASALDIKKSIGLVRGKNDKKDAQLIALYANRKIDEIIPSVLCDAKCDKLKSLLSLREKYIKHRTACKNGLSDLIDCYELGETEFIKESQKRMILHLNDEIKAIDNELLTVIENDEDLNENYKLLTSVKCIGKVLASYMLAYTSNFTRFDDPRKFSCYAGTAPFGNSSGTSINMKPKVHPCSNKQLKTLLNLAAISAIKAPGEYRTYYNKRVNEGKNKMSTVNIIRNKLIFRAFAVIKRKTPYVDLSKFAA
jgi:transposase